MSLGEPDELFRLIGETISEVLWVASADLSRMLYLSPAYERVWQRSRESAYRDPNSFLEAIHPDDVARVLHVLEDQKAGLPFDHEYRLLRADGSIRWIWDRGSPVREASGGIQRYVGVAQDITERKVAEGELEALAERFRLVSRATNDGIWDWDSVANVAWWNDAVFDILGYDHSTKPSFETWIARVHPDDRDRIFARSRGVVHPTDGVWVDEYRIVRPDGSIREILERAYVLHDSNGKVVRMVGALMDITARRNLEAQLRHAQKMEAVGQLAGGVAHDFNNILQAALLEIQLLTRRDLPRGVAERLEDVQSDLSRAAKLTRQLLVFSRREQMQPRSLDLNVVISDLVSMLRRLLDDSITLDVALASEPLHVHADRSMVDQVLMNLALNARDAMPSGGTVTIRTSLVDRGDERLACVTVHDTGTGIAPDVMPRIFEPFFTTKEIGRGTGLGLAMALSIAEQHQGFIEVESKVGGGATFRTFFPTGEPPATASPRALDGAAARGDETILVVEDDPNVRRVVRLLLEQQGYRVVEADAGPAALRAWDEVLGSIHLLFTDLMMPGGMDGRELATRLERRRPGLKVVFTTGNGSELVARDLDHNRVLLHKPVGATVLLQAIRECLDGNAPSAVEAT